MYYKEKQMMKAWHRYTLLILFCLPLFTGTSGYAGAQALSSPSSTSDREAQSEKFFQDCVAAPVVGTNPETDQAFCACAAMQLYAWLGKPAKRAGTEFFDSLENKTLDKKSLMTDVYGPCLYIPVFNLSEDECLTNKANVYFMGQSEYLHATCYCIAEEDSNYFRSYAKPFLEMAFSQGQKIDDPIDAIKRDNNFYMAHSRADEECYVEYSNMRAKNADQK